LLTGNTWVGTGAGALSEAAAGAKGCNDPLLPTLSHISEETMKKSDLNLLAVARSNNGFGRCRASCMNRARPVNGASRLDWPADCSIKYRAICSLSRRIEFENDAEHGQTEICPSFFLSISSKFTSKIKL